MEKIPTRDPRASIRSNRKSLIGSFLLTVLVVSSIFAQLWLFSFNLRSRPALDTLHPSTHTIDRKIDWSWLSHEKQCPSLKKIGVKEFTARRNRLAHLLRGEDGKSFGAYVTEPSANTLYYLNLTQANWYLSERPWLAVITSTSSSSQHHLSILTPSFEKSRSQRLPFAVESEEFDKISWVAWEEAESPYEVLVNHLEKLRKENGPEGAWSIEIEENVRQFVASGLEEAAAKSDSKAKVGLAKMVIRELRMRKTEAELEIQRCVGKITLEALRAVRKHLRIGMTEKEGEALIVNALKAGGLTDIGAIVLFGENAALPHASASNSKRLEKDEFALFDSDFTRTMLPDQWIRGKKEPVCEWPKNERSKKIFETVQRAQRAALDKLLTPESEDVVYAAEVDRAARDVIAGENWGADFTHRLGHGIGLEVHEHPYLNSGNSRQVIQPGETFSNEPGIYIERLKDTEGNGIGVRLEDMVLKTETGWELIGGKTQFKAKQGGKTYIQAFEQWDRGMMEWFPDVVLEDDIIWKIIGVYIQLFELLLKTKDVRIESMICPISAEYNNEEESGGSHQHREEAFRILPELSAMSMATQIRRFKEAGRLEELSTQAQATLHRLQLQSVLEKFPQQGNHVLRYILDFFELDPEKLDNLPSLYQPISRRAHSQKPLPRGR
ncbi:hypothetical protein JCM5350_002507 [Sporobolomyces pararoseus]